MSIIDLYDEASTYTNIRSFLASYFYTPLDEKRQKEIKKIRRIKDERRRNETLKNFLERRK